MVTVVAPLSVSDLGLRVETDTVQRVEHLLTAQGKGCKNKSIVVIECRDLKVILMELRYNLH